MIDPRETEESFVGGIEIDGRRYTVTIAISFDGVEHIGHLRFADEDWDEGNGISDPIGIPGRSPNEIVQTARQLSNPELIQRYNRALSTTRRFHNLRRATEDVLAHIRHLNKVSTSMRAGLLDVDDAAREIDATEQQLIDIVRQLRDHAGVAEERAKIRERNN